MLENDGILQACAFKCWLMEKDPKALVAVLGWFGVTPGPVNTSFKCCCCPLCCAARSMHMALQWHSNNWMHQHDIFCVHNALTSKNSTAGTRTHANAQ
jgi:hypothetical protein